MSVPPIRNEPCDCPPGQCAEFVHRDEFCVNRLTFAEVRDCSACGAHTWHDDQGCRRCRYQRETA